MLQIPYSLLQIEVYTIVGLQYYSIQLSALINLSEQIGGVFLFNFVKSFNKDVCKYHFV